MSAQVGNFSETDCLQAITGSTLVTPHDLLFAWAASLGIATSWSMGNLDTLKAIALHYGAVSVGNWSETDCYRSIAAANGASSVGSLSALDCLKTIAAWSGPDPGPLNVTNAQKLSLSPSTPAGTKVSVSDGFVVSGATGDNILANGFYTKSGQVVNGKDEWFQPGASGDSQNFSDWDGAKWAFTGGDVFFYSKDNGVFAVTFGVAKLDGPSADASFFSYDDSTEITFGTSNVGNLSTSTVNSVGDGWRITLCVEDNPTPAQIATKAVTLLTGLVSGITATSSVGIMTITVDGTTGTYSIGDSGDATVACAQISGTSAPYQSTFGADASLTHPALQKFTGGDPSNESNWSVVP